VSNDVAGFYEHLRATTAALLNYDDVDHLTGAQQIRLERAIALRLVIDDAQARQMRGEAIDVKAFVDASEDLERMVGGNPASSQTRFGPDHRAPLRELIERTVLAADVADAEHMADVMRREEAIQAQAAGVPVEAPVAPPPPEPAAEQTSQPPSNVSYLPSRTPDGRPPDHYTREPRRDHVERGGDSMMPWRNDRWSPRGF
jgi:hypothetical protein